MRLDKDVVSIMVDLHPEFSKFWRGDGSMVVKLEGGLYGLPESGKLWFQNLSNFFFKLGYNQCPSDPCIFTKVHRGDRIVISTHVDDGLYFSTSQA